MRKSIFVFGLLALAISLFGTRSWAQACGEEGNCFTFDQNNTTHTYDFGDDGKLVVQFDTVLRSFDLRVSIHVPKPTNETIPLDPKEFPVGTICVSYGTSTSDQCDQYDFTGNAGGPNGVPVKNADYKGLITLTLSYNFSGTVRNPAFGHAPGDITTFTEDILTSYSADPHFTDPTMGGKIPGLSSLVALDEPLTESDSACLTLTATNNPSEQKPQVEVALKVASGSNNFACTGAGIRDKTARLSVSMSDGTNVNFPPLKNAEGNKFHWDSKNGLNEYDISTDGLADGRYTVTAFSSKFSPQSANFCLANGSVTVGSCL